MHVFRDTTNRIAPAVTPSDKRGSTFDGQLSASLAHPHHPRALPQAASGLPRGQRLLRPAGHKLDQQPVQPVDRQPAGRAELVAAVGQQRQRDRAVIAAHMPKRPGAQRDDGD